MPSAKTSIHVSDTKDQRKNVAIKNPDPSIFVLRKTFFVILIDDLLSIRGLLKVVL
jgi:hypothetical protein